MSQEIQKIQKLRKLTNIGIVKCKKALIESKGDFNLAVKILRNMGEKISRNYNLKNTKEGVVFIKINKKKNSGIIISLACETDFVVKNELFQNLGEKISELTLSVLPDSILDIGKIKNEEGQTVNENIISLINKLGEKIKIKEYYKIRGDLIISYLHSNKKIGVLLELNKTKNLQDNDLYKDIAMQVAAMNPIAINKEDINSEIINKEIEIIKTNLIEKNIKDSILNNIVNGKIKKFYQENTLLNQKFIKDNSISILNYINKIDKELKIKKYKKIIF